MRKGKRTGRALALVCAAALIFSLLPVTSFSTGDINDDTEGLLLTTFENEEMAEEEMVEWEDGDLIEQPIDVTGNAEQSVTDPPWPQPGEPNYPGNPGGGGGTVSPPGPPPIGPPYNPEESIEKIEAAIAAYGDGGGTGSLATSVDEDEFIVTITGTITDATETLVLDIGYRVLLVWEASLSGTVSEQSVDECLMRISGYGTFEIAQNGAVMCSGGTTIYVQCSFVMTGGTVSATGGTAIKAERIHICDGSPVIISNSGTKPAIRLFGLGTVFVDGGDLSVNGNIVADGLSVGLRAENGGVANMVGNIITEGTGISAYNNGHVTIIGNVIAEGYGISAVFGSTITMTGNVEADEGDGINTGYDTVVVVNGNIKAGNLGINASSRAIVTVYGNILSDNFGIHASGGTTVYVEGDVESTNIITSSVESAPDGLLAGNATVASESAVVEVAGNVISGKMGVYVSNGGQVTITGTINAEGVYIRLYVRSFNDGITDLTLDDDKASSKAGYREYSDGSSIVWVKIRSPQPVSFPTVTNGAVNKTYGDAAFTVEAKSVGDGELSYASSNTSVATVDASGKVTILNAGTTRITATAAETINYLRSTASYTLTVKAAEPVKPNNNGGSGGGGGGRTPYIQIAAPEVPLADLNSFTPFIMGFDNNTFRGSNQMTREQFVTILFRLKGASQQSADKDKPTFADVPSARWSYNAVEWASGAGIVEADENGNFRPADMLTRAEMAVMLARAEKMTGMEENTFSDLADHPDRDDILKVVSAGIFEGYPDKTFRPGNTATRYEVVAAIVRYLLGDEPTDEICKNIEITFTDVPEGSWAYKYVTLSVNGYKAVQ